MYHWESTSQYDPETRKGGLFSSFIDVFLKMKQEASGWPEWCTTENDKANYIREYESREGVCLDKSNIEKNPGKRSLSKLLLNR